MIEIGNRVTMRRGNITGTVIDKAFSEADKEWLYCIRLDGSERSSRVYYGEDEIAEVIDDERWAYSIEQANDVVIAVLNQVDAAGNVIKEIERGHGHIMHDGVEGFVQAASYALKRIYYKVGGME